MNVFPILVAVVVTLVWSKQALSEEVKVQQRETTEQEVGEALVHFLLQQNTDLQDVRRFQKR